MEHVRGADSSTEHSSSLGWHSRTRWPFHRTLGKKAATSVQATSGSAQCCWQGLSVPCCRIGICGNDGISVCPVCPFCGTFVFLSRWLKFVYHQCFAPLEGAPFSLGIPRAWQPPSKFHRIGQHVAEGSCAHLSPYPSLGDGLFSDVCSF